MKEYSPQQRKRPTGKKAPVAKDEKSQRERFIETARALKADESGKTFENVFNKIVKSSPPA